MGGGGGGRPNLMLAQVQEFCPGPGPGQDLTGNGPGLDLDLTWDLEWDLDLSLTKSVMYMYVKNNTFRPLFSILKINIPLSIEIQLSDPDSKPIFQVDT